MLFINRRPLGPGVRSEHTHWYILYGYLEAWVALKDAMLGQPDRGRLRDLL